MFAVFSFFFNYVISGNQNRKFASGLTFPLFFLVLVFSCTTKYEITEARHADGSPKIIGRYSGKIKTGEARFYEGGKKEMEGTFNEKLLRDGKWIFWFKNGKVWSECEFKDGLKNGKSVVHYENGQKRYEGNYQNDTTIGKWIFWNEKGEVVKEMKY